MCKCENRHFHRDQTVIINLKLRTNLKYEAANRSTGRRPPQAQVRQVGDRARPHRLCVECSARQDLRRSCFNYSLAATSSVRATQIEELTSFVEAQANLEKRSTTSALRRT